MPEARTFPPLIDVDEEALRALPYEELLEVALLAIKANNQGVEILVTLSDHLSTQEKRAQELSSSVESLQARIALLEAP